VDEPEGFFPERELLAYRRSLLRAQHEPGAAARQNRFPWWVLPLGMSPVSIVWLSIQRLDTPHSHLPPTLLFGSALLVTCALILAVLGIGVGIYRGLQALMPFTRE
jgi:hypothetical protein